VIDWQPGDRIVSFSDGVPETVNERGEALGALAAEQLLCTGLDRLAQALVEFRGKAPSRDDVSAIDVVYSVGFAEACRVSNAVSLERSASIAAP